MYWMAAKIPSDQFLLYGFAGSGSEVGAVVRELRSRLVGLRIPRTRAVAEAGALGLGFDTVGVPGRVDELAGAQLALPLRRRVGIWPVRLGMRLQRVAA